MVFTVNFPSALTEEEEVLLKKYAKLKKKLQKKESQLPKSSKPEVKKPTPEVTTKLSESTADVAKEQAKKLLKSGAIKLEADSRDKHSFKRSKNWDKKSKESGDKTGVTFQPFLSQFDDDDDEELKHKSRSQDKDNEHRPYRRGKPSHEPAPKHGKTIYIRAQGISEDIARKLFTEFGNIISIDVTPEANCGFITFDNMDSSDEAIRQLNDSRTSELFSPLKVCIARRQPTYESVDNVNEQALNTSWSSIAASSALKGSAYKEQRQIISYDDDIF